MRLSVVIVSHGHAGALARTLPALRRELREGDELIVVDNDSRDPTAEVAQENGARVVAPAGNLGFAGGCNAGAAAASGDLLVLLNPDATPGPGFGEAIRDGAGFDAWMGLVLMERGGRVNTRGGVVHFTGISWAGGIGSDPAAVEGPVEVGALSGACLALPLRLWRELGGFPPEFFTYVEDADLSMRLRLRGARLGLQPAARVDHDYSFQKGVAKWRHLERNRWAMVVRTWPAALLVAVLPALLATELAVWVAAFTGGWARSKTLATGDVVRAAPRLLRERRRIQATRTISAGAFAVGLTAELDSPYLGGPAGSRAVGALLRSYWRAVRLLLRG